MSEFGYIPEAPEQSFGNNKGIFNPKDIYDLTRADKYTNYGQLELIETQTASSSSALDFTNLGDYNVHFLTVNNATVSNDNQQIFIRFSDDNGSTFKTSSYQFAVQNGETTGSFSENKSTNISYIRIVNQIGNNTNESGAGYMYLYNLLDSSKFSFTTQHSMCIQGGTQGRIDFGSGVYPGTISVNAIRVYPSGHTFSATVSLYGIRYS